MDLSCEADNGGAAGSSESVSKAATPVVAAAAASADAFTMVYEYEEGDCIFIDNLAIAHRAAPEAHEPASKVGLRVLHRTTIKAPKFFDPPFGLPYALDIHGAHPLKGQGHWQGGGLGFRWDETIPMQN